MTVRTANNAATAREAIDRADDADEPFAVVLCDAAMPGIDGFELAEQLKRSAAFDGHIIMALASLDRPEDAARCRDLGVDAYIVKPIRESDLLNALCTSLDLVGQRGEELALTAADATAGRRLNVLLAEDNVVNQQVARRMLEKRGHHVTVVGDGRQAIEAISAQRFDVALLDVQMPEMGGFEVAAAVREIERDRDHHTPLIAMTAHSLKGDRERCTEAGMDGYLAKPISAIALFDEISHLVPDVPAFVEAPAWETEGGEADSELFDRAATLQRLAGDQDLLAEVIDLFLDDYPRQRAAMRDAVKSADFAALTRIVHALRGALGNLHADRAVNAARALEDAAADNDAAAVREAMAHFTHEVDRLRPHLLARRQESDS